MLKNKFLLVALIISITLFFIKEEQSAKVLLAISAVIFGFMFYKLNISKWKMIYSRKIRLHLV